MKNSKIIVVALAIVLGFAAAVFAVGQLNTRVVTAQAKTLCCQDASCCSGGACKMNGACCGSHKSNAADTQKSEKVKFAGVRIEDETASCQPAADAKTAANKSDCCAGSGSACCHSGAACCSSKNQTAVL